MNAISTSYKINGGEWITEEKFIEEAYKLLNIKQLENVVIFPCALSERLKKKGFKITKL